VASKPLKAHHRGYDQSVQQRHEDTFGNSRYHVPAGYDAKHHTHEPMNVHSEWWVEQRNYLANRVRPASRSVNEAKAFLLGVVDEDGDGVLDNKEFSTEHFDALDKDGDGKLDKSEFKYHVDHVDPEGGGSTMLHYAASAGRLDVVKFLVSCDADLNLRDYEDRTALHRARSNAHSEVVAYLLNPIKDVIEIARPDAVNETAVGLRKPYPRYKIHPDARPIPFPEKFPEYEGYCLQSSYGNHGSAMGTGY